MPGIVTEFDKSDRGTKLEPSFKAVGNAYFGVVIGKELISFSLLCSARKTVVKY